MLNHEITPQLAREYAFACSKCGSTLSDLLPQHNDDNSIRTSPGSREGQVTTNVLNLLSCGHVLCRKHLGPVEFHQKDEAAQAQCLLCHAAGAEDPRSWVYWFCGHKEDEYHPRMPNLFTKGASGIEELTILHHNVLNFAHHWRKEAQCLKRLQNRPPTRQSGIASVIPTPRSDSSIRYMAASRTTDTRRRRSSPVLSFRNIHKRTAPDVELSSATAYGPTSHRSKQRSSSPLRPVFQRHEQLPQHDNSQLHHQSIRDTRPALSAIEREPHSNPRFSRAQLESQPQFPATPRGRPHLNIYEQQVLAYGTDAAVYSSSRAELADRSMPPPPRPLLAQSLPHISSTPMRQNETTRSSPHHYEILQEAPKIPRPSQATSTFLDQYRFEDHTINDPQPRFVQHPPTHVTSRAPNRAPSRDTMSIPTVDQPTPSSSAIPGFRAPRTKDQIPTLPSTDPQLHDTRTRPRRPQTSARSVRSSKSIVTPAANNPAFSPHDQRYRVTKAASSTQRSDQRSTTKTARREQQVARQVQATAVKERELEETMRKAFGRPFSRTNEYEGAGRSGREVVGVDKGAWRSNGGNGIGVTGRIASRPATAFLERVMPGSRRAVRR